LKWRCKVRVETLPIAAKAAKSSARSGAARIALSVRLTLRGSTLRPPSWSLLLNDIASNLRQKPKVQKLSFSG